MKPSFLDNIFLMRKMEKSLMTTYGEEKSLMTGVMRKMAVDCEHFRRAVRGDLPAKDESSKEDDDTESDDKSKLDY